MTSLFDYMKSVQRLIRDTGQKLVDPGDLVEYINRARREVAMRAQCMRVLTPISASVVSIDVIAGGADYTNPIVEISAPDFPSNTLPFPNGAQATAIATQIGGIIQSVNITFGGAGYFQPVATIIDATGSGAVLAASLTVPNNNNPVNQALQGQEVYPFSQVDLSPFPGFGAVYMILSVSIIYANYRYSLPMYAFSVYQALVRQYPFQYEWVPTIGSQYGQGTSGSFYLYPLPSQPYQMEWDCFCLPQDLQTDQDFEALPAPWTDAVPFLAAYYAYNELQNWNVARYYQEEFDKWMSRYGAYARPGRVINPYGRP